MTAPAKKKKSFFDYFLNFLEKGGNALPHPATLFALFAVSVLILSAVGFWLNWQATHPATGEVISTINLLSKEGIAQILEKMVTNFTSFAPLGIVLVAMLGIGIAETSGLIGVFIRMLVLSAPKRILTFVIVFAGILSNAASDIGYVLLIPLSGVIFQAMGRHPYVGMAAAFAGVSGGFSANLIIGTIDPLLAGLSEEAAHILDPGYHVNPTANYYFMVVSTFLVALLGTWVTEKIIQPRFGTYDGEVKQETIEPLSKKEKKGVLWSLIVLAGWLVVIAVGVIPEDGILRDGDGGLLSSPLMTGIITFLFLIAGSMGVVYGAITGVFKNDTDVANGMAQSLKTLAHYIVLVFFAAQFVAYFRWSNLGVIMAITGAEGLVEANLGVVPLMLLFILLAAFVNMLMGSASAKWAIMAPIFIPIFMLLGYSPELSQAVYRIGDSVTNVISPMMSFFALIIAYFQKYDKNAGLGTIIATMIPYSIAFFIGWSILLIGWIMLGIPLGPGAELFYELPAGE
ncbi:AbgT family transporter [Alkalitalea saponilacus]|uniref:Aminobenzoyl-glutamate transport protein n=1 Tax=Alkalitalea saponilacus TaxID=889453 RepID=A0A1T5HS31_9BACT|nr:AbgT family transporter [Alkalitalea saponilacus]ASB50005.1 aminobenzoyl-glutamate transporter [Alkalitalea saponilacus]SKC23485.1 aminobenzoyl-glutamate transport protein [Alkalitalea saponilacus]